MAATMEAEQTPTILETFDLRGEDGDDLTGDVEEALDRVKQVSTQTQSPNPSRSNESNTSGL